jgi:hypothetical protein
MGPWNRALSAGLLAATAAVPFAPAARAESFKDERLGYGFSYPQRWDTVPVDSGGYLAAKFQSNRTYEWNDPKTNAWTYHKPYIEVVVIPFAAKDGSGVTVDKSGKETKVVSNAPWKDLKEYMDKIFQERRIGGFHFSGEEEATVNGMKVRRLEITVDKLVQGERRIYGWEFSGEDCFYGLVAEILLKEEKRLKPDLFQSFSTFKAFPRSGKLPGTATPGDDVVVKDPRKESERERTPEEIKKERDDATARHLNRLKEGMGKDWTVREGRNFIAVTHSDPKYTQEVLQHAEALRAWLESNLGFVGSGYAGKVILRIFADRQEHDAYQSTRRTWYWDSPEVTTFKDKEGWDWSWNSAGFNQRIYHFWLRDKNDRLAWSMPTWLVTGITTFIGNARMKSGRIDFKADVWDSVEMKNLRRSDSLIHVREFFTTTWDSLSTREGFYYQNQFFIDFLLAGGAQRSARYKGILADYLKNLVILLDSEETSAAVVEEKPPQTEEEETERFRQRQNAWKAREQEHLQKLVERTFPGWTDRDWDLFNAAYRQDLK